MSGQDNTSNHEPYYVKDAEVDEDGNIRCARSTLSVHPRDRDVERAARNPNHLTDPRPVYPSPGNGGYDTRGRLTGYGYVDGPVMINGRPVSVRATAGTTVPANTNRPVGTTPSTSTSGPRGTINPEVSSLPPQLQAALDAVKRWQIPTTTQNTTVPATNQSGVPRRDSEASTPQASASDYGARMNQRNASLQVNGSDQYEWLDPALREPTMQASMPANPVHPNSRTASLQRDNSGVPRPSLTPGVYDQSLPYGNQFAPPQFPPQPNHAANSQPLPNPAGQFTPAPAPERYGNYDPGPFANNPSNNHFILPSQAPPAQNPPLTYGANNFNFNFDPNSNTYPPLAPAPPHQNQPSRTATSRRSQTPAAEILTLPLGPNVGLPLPARLGMLVAALRNLGEMGSSGHPERKFLKKPFPDGFDNSNGSPEHRLIRGHFHSGSGLLKDDCEFMKWYGDENVFEARMWEFLVVQKARPNAMRGRG